MSKDTCRGVDFVVSESERDCIRNVVRPALTLMVESAVRDGMPIRVIRFDEEEGRSIIRVFASEEAAAEFERAQALK